VQSIAHKMATKHMGRSPTLSDVARVAGVSTSTVSRALNDSPRLPEQTKSRIRAVVAKLKYEPNYIARSLIKQRTHTIGVVLEDILNPFFTEVAKGIETALKKHGYTMLLTSSGFVSEDEEELTRTLLRNRVDGVLITPVDSDSRSIRMLQDRRVPFFIMNGKSTNPEISWVDSDNLEGGRLATEYLLNLGHRCFLYLRSKKLQGSRDRFEGFRLAIKSRGLRMQDQVILGGAESRRDGHELVAGFLREKKTDVLPSALMAVNDAVAVGAMECLLERRVRIPQDMSLIGYDDIYLASLLRVPLTTVHQSKFKMGEMAATGLIERINRGTAGEASHILIRPRLILRDSCTEPLGRKPRGYA
jgi:LacI family transcriptional regulator